jgi:7-cyano-7-deazaguanine synthase
VQLKEPAKEYLGWLFFGGKIMKTTKAFVLLSGGIDSSTCLAYAIRDCGRHNVTAISINYGQRHLKEIEAAAKVCSYFGVDQGVYVLAEMPRVMLTDPNAPVPNKSYAEIEGVSPTYVPFRNGQLISKIAGIAAHEIGQLNEMLNKTAPKEAAFFEVNGMIYFGAHAEDAAGDAYPDCRLDFVGAMAAAVYIGTYHSVRLRAPLIEMYKDEIIAAGEKLHVPWRLTWSCYKGEELHCGTCPTCRARQDGFSKAGVSDPTIYADEVAEQSQQ